MSLSRALTALLLAAAACCAACYLAAPAPSAAAQGQQDRPIRVAVANTLRIFNEVRETKDMEARLAGTHQAMVAELKPLKDKADDLAARKGNFRTDSPQFEQWQADYFKAANEHKVWTQLKMAELDWEKKRQTRAMYRKIYDAIEQYAQKHNLDLVLTDHQPQLGDKEMASVPFEQMATLMNQRRVLYASKTADISDEVIALMDTQYKGAPAANAGGGAGGSGK